MTRYVQVRLTDAQAESILSALALAFAGDPVEVFGDGRLVGVADRARAAVEHALTERRPTRGDAGR